MIIRIHICLLEYLATLTDTKIPSPSNLLYNREIRSLLPKFGVLNKGDDRWIGIKNSLKNREERQKQIYDKSVRAKRIIDEWQGKGAKTRQDLAVR